jgi:hypothetical protein
MIQIIKKQKYSHFQHDAVGLIKEALSSSDNNGPLSVKQVTIALLEVCAKS